MDKNTKQGHKESQGENYKGNECNNHSKRIRRSVSNCRLEDDKIKLCSEQNERAHTHSRSRSPCSTKSSKRWISSNAFINFVQDIRENFPGTRSTKIFQMAGERWRNMSSEERQPYIKAALDIKNQKQKNKSVTKLVDISTEQTKNKDTVKVEKADKKETKEKKPKKLTKQKSTTESDSDSNTSGTTISKSSRDVSDTSS